MSSATPGAGAATMAHAPGFLALSTAAKGRIREVRAADVPPLLAAAGVLVDVREESEWSDGHVAGATWLGKGILERDVERVFPDRQQLLCLYCGSGLRSALAADSLQTMGYGNAVSVDGGYKALSQLMPVVAGSND